MNASTPTPPPPVPTAPIVLYPSGAEILEESWLLIRRTPWVIALPFVVLLIGGVSQSIVVTVLAHSLSNSARGHVTASVIGAVVVIGSAVAILGTVVQALGLIAIDAAADGRDAGPAASLRSLTTRAAPLLAWAVLSVVVGVLLRAVSRVIPFGSLARLAGAIGWGASTFLALPVMIVERRGPIAAVRRSSRMLGKAWRPVLRSVARTAWRLLATIPLFIAVVIGVAMIAHSQPGSGTELAGEVTVTIAITLLVAVQVIFVSILTAARMTIYRYVTGPFPRL